MKRYEITTGGHTYKYMADDHSIDPELKTITIRKNGQTVCMFGIQGIILQIRDEEELKLEEQAMHERAKFLMDEYKKLNEKKSWTDIIFK